MDNLQNLFIRAAKSKNPEKRIRSIMRRFYLNDNPSVRHIRMIYGKICDENDLISLPRFLGEFENKERMDHLMETYDDSYYFGDRIATILIDCVGLCRVDRLPYTYRAGRRWKN